MVCDTPPYSHAPTYQLSFTYLERQKCYGPDKKILFKKQLFDLKVKVPRRSLRYATHRLIVMHPHTKYHWPISKDRKVMVWTSFAEKKWKKRKKKIRLKQYVSLRSKGRHNYLKICSQCLSSLKFDSWWLVYYIQVYVGRFVTRSVLFSLYSPLIFHPIHDCTVWYSFLKLCYLSYITGAAVVVIVW
jgi:hypothetical protein